MLNVYTILTHEVARNIFLWKVHSISSDVAWRFLNNNGWMRSKFTFSSKVFERWANKLVWYLFETLPVPTRFNPELMVFLIEVYFRKGSKIVTMLSKMNKVRKLWHLCCKLDELHPSFFKFAFWIPHCFNAKVIGSSIRKLPWFEQKLESVCQTCIFVVSRIFGSKTQFSPKLPTGDTRISHCWVFLNLFMQGSSSKNV